MLKYSEPNPLNIHGLRQLEHLPPHFTPVFFELYTSERNIENWIWENLEGRFFLNDYHTINETDLKIHIVKCAAFELSAEASYFSLMLNTFNVSSFL
jgi:hypothetical protein